VTRHVFVRLALMLVLLVPAAARAQTAAPAIPADPKAILESLERAFV
jgi:hypothetical protein